MKNNRHIRLAGIFLSAVLAAGSMGTAVLAEEEPETTDDPVIAETEDDTASGSVFGSGAISRAGIPFPSWRNISIFSQSTYSAPRILTTLRISASQTVSLFR